MKTNLKITLASLVLIASLGTSGGSAMAAHEGVAMTPEQQMNQLLTDLSVFLMDVQTYIGSPAGMPSTPTTDTAAADLRVTMNNLFSEHVDISAEVMRNIIDDSDNLIGSLDAQMNNAVELAEAFGSLYGSDVQALVAEAFVEHIEFSNEYAQAVEDMDEDAKDAANEELDEYLREIAILLSSVIDTVDEETAYTVLRQHEDLLNEAAEQYKNGDYIEAYQTEREALQQIQVVSDVLSQGIVETMPEDF